jgi:hypothetical protein
MINRKFNKILVIGIGILTISLVGLGGCAQSNAVVAVPFQPLLNNPIEITSDQLSSEYLVDEASADAKYKGKRVQFTEEVVELVHGHFSTGEAFIYDLEHNREILMDYFVVVGSIRFEPRRPTNIYGIQEGTVIDIEGDVLGMSQEGLIIIENCWINIITGEIPSGY